MSWRLIPGFYSLKLSDLWLAEQKRDRVLPYTTPYDTRYLSIISKRKAILFDQMRPYMHTLCQSTNFY